MTYVHTGRPGRLTRCPTCHLRFKLGQPKSNLSWSSRLRVAPLTPEQFDLLLVGFAEFMELGGGDPIDALDWIKPDALGTISHVYPEFTGRAVTENGGPHPGSQVARQSEPFPLPVANRKVRV